MALHDWLAGDDLRGRVLRPIYELGYAALRTVVQCAARPAFRLRRVGPPLRLPDGPLLVCANHASYLDPAFVQLVLSRRVVFVMTNDFYRRGWGRWFFALVGAIPVGAGRSARAGLHQAVDVLRRGGAVAVFPEGRLSRDGSLSPPQRGVAIMARMGRAPVLPVGIAGNYEVWPRGAARPHRGDVRVAFGQPLAPPRPSTHTREQERAFAAAIMQRVAAAIEAARAGGAPRPPAGR